jgi:hypothetical protein
MATRTFSGISGPLDQEGGTLATLESTSRIFGPLDPLAQRIFAASGDAAARRHLADLAALVERP